MDAPSNKGKQEGRQTGTQAFFSSVAADLALRLGPDIQTNWYTSWETNGTRTWEGGQTIQQREKRRETWETRGKTDTPPNKGKQEQRPAGRQGLGKTRAPSKKRKQEGKQAGRRTPKGTRRKDNLASWETSWETSWGTRGTSVREGTPPNKGKQKGRQCEIIHSKGTADAPSNKGKQEGTQGRQDLGKADSHVGRQ